MSAPAPAIQVLSFRPYRPAEYPPSLSSVQVKEHERLRNRGFTPEEVHWFKSRNRWIGGQAAEPKATL